jgi:hypothetical protein
MMQNNILTGSRMSLLINEGLAFYRVIVLFSCFAISTVVSPSKSTTTQTASILSTPTVTLPLKKIPSAHENRFEGFRRSSLLD